MNTKQNTESGAATKKATPAVGKKKRHPRTNKVNVYMVLQAGNDPLPENEDTLIKKQVIEN